MKHTLQPRKELNNTKKKPMETTIKMERIDEGSVTFKTNIVHHCDVRKETRFFNKNPALVAKWS